MPKIVLITGATSGIGEACAHIFAKNNYHIIITGRRNERLIALKTFLEANYKVQVMALNFDISDNQQVNDTLLSIPPQWKKIDILINNAGLSLGLMPIQEGITQHWDTMIDTNVKGLLYVSKIVSNWMIAHKTGHIVNLGSIAGKEIYANGNVYCATKYAVEALNKAMRIDLLPYRIKVTGIHPGAVETEFSEIRFLGDKEKAKKVYTGYDALKPEDIAETIWFTCNTPVHVNINDIVIMPLAQASATYWHKIS
ncbi:MAG: SDR family NAD(P)-dependent oxidoreductase [Sphingobacteriales bacterium]|jgi:3-hydroxy acid dehydrogenase/malonic semialdehyde reductase|nr:MAG: SDR family NAD(P)-dependent oxidoreductase [Sphingobacteriales bacterium]